MVCNRRVLPAAAQEVWDLRTNRISAEGCKALAPMIGRWADRSMGSFVSAVPGHMVVARLGCNPLGDAGGERLAMLELYHVESSWALA